MTPSEARLIIYLQTREENMILGRRVARDLGNTYRVASILTAAELKEIRDNLDRQAAADAKRERRRINKERGHQAGLNKYHG